MLRKTPAARDEYDMSLAELPDMSIGPAVMERVAMKGFCVINLGLEDGLIKQALEDQRLMSTQGRFYQPAFQVMEGLLGPEGSSHIAEMDPPDTESPDYPSLAKLDLRISEVGRDILPYADQLGMQISHRSSTVVHEAGPAEDDTPPLTEKVVSKWLSQFQRHEVMAVLFLGPSKGVLELRPYDNDDTYAFEVRTSPGMLVMLRPQLLSHNFSAPGNAVTLTSFFLTSKHMQQFGASLTVPMTPVARELDEWVLERLKQIKQSEHEDSVWDPEIPREWQLAMNHMFHKGQMILVKGISINTPTFTQTDPWFSSQIAGIDLVTSVPTDRWDHSQHYVPWSTDPEGWRYFKTYCNHVAFMDGLELFDPKIFGMSPAEAKSIDPNQRMILEICYEGMHNAGLRKKQMMNANIGHYCGFGCLEWNFAEKSGEGGAFAATGSAASIVSNRLNFVLGMKGPSMTIDTEGASSLTALYLGAEACQKKGRGQQNPYSVASGIHLNLAPAFWANHCAAGWLSHTSRCMTFDASADGYTRSDATCSAVVKGFDDIDGIMKDEEQNMAGLIAAGIMNQNGLGASLNAPSGPAEQEAISEAVRNAHISPLDVDAVEAHGVGAFLSDAIEVGSLLRGHRSEMNKETLAITAYKTGVGYMVEAAALVAFIRTLVNGTWGKIAPIRHLNQINPHIDEADNPVNIGSETIQFRLKSSFVGTLARGFGGSNVYMLNHSQQDPTKVLQPEPLGQMLSFWPGGGGTLDEEMVPSKSYYIAGSFNRWGGALAMEKEIDGSYGFTVTLGENSFEQFQIWLDGDSTKVLHPGWEKAATGAPVLGPTSDGSSHDLNWMIDGRGELQDFWKPLDEVPEADKDSIVRCETDIKGKVFALQQVAKPTPESGIPGDRYRVRLQLLGKWRSVTWSKVGAPAVGTRSSSRIETGSYYIVGSWGDWSFQDLEKTSDGKFSRNVTLTRKGGEFQIVRDKDWMQVFYPASPQGSADEHIVGPLDGGHGYNWFIDGKAGETYCVTFERKLEDGKDLKKVSWELQSKT